MQGEWLRLREAAEVLGVSVDTLRRRIKRGEVQARRVETRQGYTYEVFVGAGETPDVRDLPSQGTDVQLLELVRDLTQRNEELAGQLGYWRGRAEELQGQVERLQLPAPEPAPPSPPWWRFWSRR